MNFLVKPKNLDYRLDLFDSAGELVSSLKGSDALTALGSIEKSVDVTFLSTVSSGDVSLVSDNVYPDVAYKEAHLYVFRSRSFTLPGYEPETMEKLLFKGEVTLPYQRDASNGVKFPLRSYLISKNVEADFDLGVDFIKNHVSALLTDHIGIPVDAASFAALDDGTAISLNIEKDWFSTYNEIIQGLCWIAQFAIVFDGRQAVAVPLNILPASPKTIENSDILLESFGILTRGENDIITRYDLTDPLSGRLNWYNNVHQFGDNIEALKIPYAGLFTAPVTDSANFWLNNRSRLWLNLNLKLPYKYADLEPYSTVALSDLGQWVPNLNLQTVKRLHFDLNVPCLFDLDDDVRRVFAGGGFVWLKIYAEEAGQLFDLGDGSGLFVDSSGNLSLEVNEGTWVVDTPISFDTLYSIALEYDEDNLSAVPVIKIDGVVATTVDTQPTVPSTYGTTGSSLGDFTGYVFDVLFFNQLEEISVFHKMDIPLHGTMLGTVEATPVPGLVATGVDEAFGRVQRVTLNLDGTLTALIETDIDAVSGHRDLTYWTGPENRSGIQILGQTVAAGGLATLRFKPLVSGFTKFELTLDKNSVLFHSNDNIANDADVIEYDVQLTDLESHTYTWRVRGYMDGIWQSWTFTSQFRWIPDEWSDGRITNLEWVNNEFVNSYGPEYDQLVPTRGRFVVNAPFDRLQVRAANTIEFTAPTDLPQGIDTAIQASLTDKRFYVRGLDYTTQMYSDWYLSPEYADHPGAPDAPTGYTDEITALGYTDNTGPVFWRQSIASFPRIILNIPARASGIKIRCVTLKKSGNIYYETDPIYRDFKISDYPYSTGVISFNIVDTISTEGGVAGVYDEHWVASVVGPDNWPRWKIFAVRFEAIAYNAFGESEVAKFCSTLTINRPSLLVTEYTAAQSCPSDWEEETQTVRTETSLESPNAPAPSGGGVNYITPNPVPSVPIEEQDPDQTLPPAQTSYGNPFFHEFDVSGFAPTGAVYAVLPFKKAENPSLTAFNPAGSPPDLLSEGTVNGVIDQTYLTVIENGKVKIPANNLADWLTSKGRGRATWVTAPAPANPVSLPDGYNSTYAFKRGGAIDKAAHIAVQIWFYDRDGNAIGENSDFQQDQNKEDTVIVGVADLAADLTALNTKTVEFDNAWQTIEFPCRAPTINDLTNLTYPPCGPVMWSGSFYMYDENSLGGDNFIKCILQVDKLSELPTTDDYFSLMWYIEGDSRLQFNLRVYKDRLWARVTTYSSPSIERLSGDLLGFTLTDNSFLNICLDGNLQDPVLTINGSNIPLTLQGSPTIPDHPTTIQNITRRDLGIWAHDSSSPPIWADSWYATTDAEIRVAYLNFPETFMDRFKIEPSDPRWSEDPEYAWITETDWSLERFKPFKTWQGTASSDFTCNPYVLPDLFELIDPPDSELFDVDDSTTLSVRFIGVSLPDEVVFEGDITTVTLTTPTSSYTDVGKVVAIYSTNVTLDTAGSFDWRARSVNPNQTTPYRNFTVQAVVPFTVTFISPLDYENITANTPTDFTVEVTAGEQPSSVYFDAGWGTVTDTQTVPVSVSGNTYTYTASMSIPDDYGDGTFIEVSAYLTAETEYASIWVYSS